MESLPDIDNYAGYFSGGEEDRSEYDVGMIRKKRNILKTIDKSERYKDASGGGAEVAMSRTWKEDAK